MDRVFDKGAAASPPSPPATPSTGYPTGGDPATGQMPTQPGPYWFHQITEELRNAIVAAGLTPDHTQLTQLRDAINALISRNAPVMPAGTIIAWPDITPPADHLECNGAAISRTAYAALFAVIGTRFGAGDGATTFNLPDLRGEFIRGWDNGRGVDAGRALGSWQADEIRAHEHPNGMIWGGVNQIAWVAGGALRPGGTGLVGGSETRPRNIALMYCIKYQ